MAKGWELVLERIPAWPHVWIDMFPVVEPGALYLTFIKRKAKRFDEVQQGAGSQACAASVSGVPVNFGMHEYDVRCQFLPLQCFLRPTPNCSSTKQRRSAALSLLAWIRSRSTWMPLKRLSLIGLSIQTCQMASRP